MARTPLANAVEEAVAKIADEEGRTTRRQLLTVALVLTQVWFPQRYFDYALEFRNAGVVLTRDLVLVALLAVLAWPLRLARTG